MPASFRAVGTVNSGTTGSPSAVVPTVSTGDRLYFVMVTAQGTASSPSTNMPTGYTYVGSRSDSTGGVSGYLYEKKNAPSTDSGTTVTFGTTISAGWRAVVYAVQGASTAAALEDSQASGTAGTSSTSLPFAAATAATTSDYELVISCVRGLTSGQQNSQSIAGYTARLNDTAVAGGARNLGVAVLDKTPGTAGTIAGGNVTDAVSAYGGTFHLLVPDANATVTAVVATATSAAAAPVLAASSSLTAVVATATAGAAAPVVFGQITGANLMGYDAATAENGVACYAGNTTPQVSALAADGTGAVQVNTSSGSFHFAVGPVIATLADRQANAAPVTPGNVYTAMIATRVGTAAGSAFCFLGFYDSAGGSLTSSFSAGGVLSSSYRVLSVSLTAPASAAYAVPFLYTTTSSNGTIIADDFGIFAGSTVNTWSAPPITTNATVTAVVATATASAAAPTLAYSANVAAVVATAAASAAAPTLARSANVSAVVATATSAAAAPVVTGGVTAPRAIGAAIAPHAPRLFALNGGLNSYDGNQTTYLDVTQAPGSVLRATGGGISRKWTWANQQSTDGGAISHTNIDNFLSDVAAVGQRAVIRIQPGTLCPQWVLDAIDAASGTKVPLDPTTNTNNRSWLPAPWDSTYLTKWAAFVSGLGALYDGNSNVYYVAVTGGGTVGEMNLPDTVLSAAYIAPPSGLTATASTSSGTLTAATYYYTVTALTAAGETTAPTKVSATLGSAGHVTVTWTAPSLAAGQSLTGYHIFRTTSSGAAGNNVKSGGSTLVVAAGTTTWADDGSFTVGTTNPPTSQTAVATTDLRSYVPGHSVGSPGTWADFDTAIISAWHTIVDAFVSAFPTTSLSLGLDSPVGPDDYNPAVRNSIAAYLIAQAPTGHAILQQNFLSKNGDPAEDLIASYVGTVRTGYQTSNVMSGTTLNYTSADAQLVLNYVETRGADFFEMFGTDVVFASYLAGLSAMGIAVTATSNPTAVVATATASAPVPVLHASATVTAVVATATASAAAPTLSRSANVAAVVATATASAPAPALSTGWTLAAVVATATASAAAPVLAAGSSVTAVVATATASASAPTLTGSANVSAVVATATAAAPAPVFSIGANVLAPVATATATAFTPSVGGNVNVTVVAIVATASASAAAPTFTRSANPSGVVATATSSAAAPVLSLGGTYAAVVATATASAAAPVPHAGASPAAVAAVASALAPAPTLSLSSAYAAVVATATATAPAPALSLGGTFAAVVATATASAAIPSLRLTANVTAAVATASATAPVPLLSAGALLAAAVATALADAYAPVITAINPKRAVVAGGPGLFTATEAGSRSPIASGSAGHITQTGGAP